ncbi:acetate kinase [Deferribacterales bacterium RsTz2092]|nr:acetate kinase [Deferribacterales bacterium]
MKIMTLNSGSSSVKFSLYDWSNRRQLVSGMVERIGQTGSRLVYKAGGKQKVVDRKVFDHIEAIKQVLDLIVDKNSGFLDKISDIAVVAHRIVHGGRRFVKSVLINSSVMADIKRLISLAPLHNGHNLSSIKAMISALPDTPQVAVFDTAFHQSIPDYAYMYALPYEWYDKHRIRKYGFHGISHLFVSKRAASMLGKPASECNLITMHIGNGASVSAIKNGLSVDTTMGLTPMEGVIMGTRCGDIDPGILFHISNLTGMNTEQIYDILNTKSGILGITGKYSDRREVMENIDSDKHCRLAFEMEAYRLKMVIGKYMAILGRVDAIVWTAGVGEHQPQIREKTLEGLEHFGVNLDIALNEQTTKGDEESCISAPTSKVKVFIIPTNEEQVLVEDAVGVLNGSYTDHMHYEYSFL